MSYSFDNVSILKDGRRIFPVMGEIHYSRVPRAEWKERLLKMKAGGVTLVSAYVIWIHHEEIEGVYDWRGDRSLRDFVGTVQKCGLKLLLRIGPWVHAETRNGGFPDWLLKKDYEVRTNDEKYFAAVEKWYKKIYEQVSDFIANPEDASSAEKPIIGIQVENEYGHCGGLYEKEGGEAHMRRLQKIAMDAGFKVALYTATGWGGAWTGDMLPVMGGYCDAPWDQRTGEIEPSGNYTFTHERNDHNIGSDHGFGYGITFDIEKFPYLTAELGGGLQVTSHRRTIATAKDIAAVAMTKVGSGCNLLGFYMYSGGTNPDGKLTTLQESRATGYLNDLPVKSYDFRAPIREFGQVSSTFREIKLLALFAKAYGEEICSLPAVIKNEIRPDDASSLRYSFRSDGKKGYLFVNNYVRHLKMAEHRDIHLESPDGKTHFPPFDVKNGDFFFFPFNIKYGKSLVKTARVTPLTKLSLGKNELFVFYKRENDSSDKNFFDFGTEESEKIEAKDKFLVLSRTDALNSWITDGRLFITDSLSSVFEDENGEIQLLSRSEPAFFVYPGFDKAPVGWKKCGEENKNASKDMPEILFSKYELEVAPLEKKKIKIGALKSGENYKLDLSILAKKFRKEKYACDIFVKIDYTGESGRLYASKDGKRLLILDHFYLGEDYPWEIGIKRFLEKDADCALSDEELSSLELEISPLKKGEKIYIEKWPDFDGEEISSLKSVTYEIEWKYKIGKRRHDKITSV